MASKSKSRWATANDDDPESSALAVQRKKEKEERKRLKQENAAKAVAAQASATKATNSALDGQATTSDRPSKRRRLSPDIQQAVESSDASNLLQFPTAPIGPCENVDKYEMLNNIEEGSYGMVSRARRKTTGEIVALKRLKMDHVNDGFPVTGLREIQTLMACRHVNVINLREVVMGETLKDVYLVMDFVEHDLKTLLEEIDEPLLPSEIKTLMLQISAATEYLHSHWILHRDLKTSNLLLNNRGEIKLADFGMARYTANPPPKLTQLVVTLWYRAPELLLGTDDYGFEIDIWSLGCIFAELLTKEPLFFGKNEVDQLSKIFALLGWPNKDSWPGFKTLPNAKALQPLLSKASPKSSLTISKFPYLTNSGLNLLSLLLSLNPESRLSAQGVLQHSYFKEDPRPKPKEMFPTFPSKAGQERRRRRTTPQAPVRGAAPKLEEEDFASIFAGRADEEKGAGFALRLG